MSNKKQEFAERIKQRPLVIVIDNDRGNVAVLFFYILTHQRIAGMAKFEWRNGTLAQSGNTKTVHNGITADALWTNLINVLTTKTGTTTQIADVDFRHNCVVIVADDEAPWRVEQDLTQQHKNRVKVNKALLQADTSKNTLAWSQTTAKAIKWL